MGFKYTSGNRQTRHTWKYNKNCRELQNMVQNRKLNKINTRPGEHRPGSRHYLKTRHIYFSDGEKKFCEALWLSHQLYCKMVHYSKLFNTVYTNNILRSKGGKDAFVSQMTQPFFNCFIYNRLNQFMLWKTKAIKIISLYKYSFKCHCTYTMYQ